MLAEKILWLVHGDGQREGQQEWSRFLAKESTQVHSNRRPQSSALYGLEVSILTWRFLKQMQITHLSHLKVFSIVPEGQLILMKGNFSVYLQDKLDKKFNTK